MSTYQGLRAAIQTIADSWESGDLAAAVRDAVSLAQEPEDFPGPPYMVEGCEHCAGCGEVAWECVCEQVEED